MNETVIPGIVTPAGTLELGEKLALPAGPVQVTIMPLTKDDPFWQRMQAIWAGQKERGHVPRSVEQVGANKQLDRQQWDERMKRLESIQAAARATRKSGSEQP